MVISSEEVYFMYKTKLISCDSPCWLQRCWQMIQRTDQVLLWVGQLQRRYFLLWLLVRAPWRKPMIEMYIYSHCLQVAITTPEGGSWRYLHIKISHPARKGWPRHRGVHSLFFSNSGVGSLTSHKNHIRRGSTINTDRFPKGGPKAQASWGGGWLEQAPPLIPLS